LILHIIIFASKPIPYDVGTKFYRSTCTINSVVIVVFTSQKQ